jgi:hypothetical protein
MVLGGVMNTRVGYEWLAEPECGVNVNVAQFQPQVYLATLLALFGRYVPRLQRE